MTLDRDRIARALPSYEIGDEIGRGAWGVVVRATHRQLGRAVAVKELPEAFAADPGVRRRFVSEARLLATLDHPHVVPIYDYVEGEGLCLLVMELLSGGTVWGRFTTDGVSADAACSIAVATCSALHHAHGKGILHRDVKPENLLFTETGTLKVSDFGIAKVVGGAESMGTRTGEVLGTPGYMAPEQALGQELTPATDVYALGTVLYELLSGRLPFSDDGNAIAVLYRHVHEDPVALTEITSDLPPTLAEVTMRSLARQPGDRDATAEDFGVALAEAATAAWGRGWVHHGGVNVMAAGRIGERITGPQPAAAAVAAPPERRTRSARAPVTMAESAGTSPEEDGGAALAASPDELVPLKEVVPADAAPQDPGTQTTHPPLAPTTVPRAPETAPPAPAEAAPGPARARRRRALILIGIAVVAVLAIIAVVVLTGGGGSSKARPSTPGSAAVAATISVGQGADHVAVGSSAVWVTDSSSRAVTRIDPKNNAASAIATLDQTPHSVAVGTDSLWVTTGGEGVVRIQPGSDPSTTRTTTISIGTQLAEVAEGEGAVWATAPQAGALLRIDENANRVASLIGVGAAPDSVAVGEGAVWVANRTDTGTGTVTRVDPSTNRVVATIGVGGRPDQVAVGEGSVWVANAADGTVSRIDPATNKVTATIKVGATPQWVAVGEGAAWVTNTGASTVSRIEPATNTVTATIPVGPGAESSAVGEGGVWVVNKSDGTVSRITPSSRRSR